MTRHIWLPVLFTINRGRQLRGGSNRVLSPRSGQRLDLPLRPGRPHCGSRQLPRLRATRPISASPVCRTPTSGCAWRATARSTVTTRRAGASASSRGSAPQRAIPTKPSRGRAAARATIASRKTNYKGPIGQFDNALEIRYTESACRDAGITREVYLPWVGLVERNRNHHRRPPNLPVDLRAAGRCDGDLLERAGFPVDPGPAGVCGEPDAPGGPGHGGAGDDRSDGAAALGRRTAPADVQFRPDLRNCPAGQHGQGDMALV